MADDWLDDLRRKDAGLNADEQRRRDSQVHDDRTIRAKAPELWAALIERVRNDCTRLESHGANRQAQVVREHGNYFALERKQLPIRSIALELNLDGHFIRSVKSVRNEFDQGPRPETEQIDIKLDADGSLVLKSQDGDFRTVQDLARHLFAFVLELDA